MKIDVTKAFIGADGPMDTEGRTLSEPVPGTSEADAAKRKPMTFQSVVTKAFWANIPTDAALTGEEKYKMGKIARRFHEATEAPNLGVVDLSIEETAMVKARIGKVWSAMVIEQAWDMMEAAPDAKPAKK